MPRILICSTPRVGSVSYAEKLSNLLRLPLAFQPWEPYAFNKQPESVRQITLNSVDTKNVVIHSHIHACLDKISTMDCTVYIGRRDRIKQAWSFFVALHLGKMQNLNIENIVIPEPTQDVVSMFIRWINLWDQTSVDQHKIYYEDLDLSNDKWNRCVYKNIQIQNFSSIENQIKDQCRFLINTPE